MKSCRSCDAPVRFAKAASGKWMILDAEPTPEGNVVLFLDEREAGHVNAVVFKNAAAAETKFPGRRRYVDHHSTCPQAKEWRGRANA